MKIKYIKTYMKMNRESHFRVVWDRDCKRWTARIEGCIEDVKVECDPIFHKTMKHAIISLNCACKTLVMELEETEKVENKLLKKYNPDEF